MLEEEGLLPKKENLKPKFWRCGNIARQQKEMRKTVNDSQDFFREFHYKFVSNLMEIERKEDDEIEMKINEMEQSKKKNDKITNEKDVDSFNPISCSEVLWFNVLCNGNKSTTKMINPNSYTNVASVLGKHRLVYIPRTS